MILRRITEHLRKQHWTAVAIDFVIVVLGVFVGLQAQAWNESRQDRVQEHMYIERLTRDFTTIEERTEAARVKWQSIVDNCRRLLADVDEFKATGRTTRTQDQILADLNGVQGGRIPAPQAATFVELLATGEIRVLRDSELRDALLAYDTQAHYALVAYGVLVERSNAANVAISTHLEALLPETLQNITVNTTAPVYASVDFVAFARDPETRNALKLLAIAAINQGGLSVAQRDSARRVLHALQATQ